METQEQKFLIRDGSVIPPLELQSTALDIVHLLIFPYSQWTENGPKHYFSSHYVLGYYLAELEEWRVESCPSNFFVDSWTELPKIKG